MPSTEPWEATPRGEVLRSWWDPGITGVPAIPLLSAIGRMDGPTVLVTGGVHGDEYEGPAAIHALFAYLDREKVLLRGRVLGVPVINIAAWQTHSRLSPVDGVNLNRVFPGNPLLTNGPSRALAGVIFRDLVSACDVLVDLHSGGAALDHLPLIGWYRTDDGMAANLARRFGMALHPWILPAVPGVLSYETSRLGKIAVAAEWRGGARLDPYGARAYALGLQRLLVLQEMLPPDQLELVHDPREPIAGDYQDTDVGGLFLPRVALGDQVAQGQILGTMQDVLGMPVADVTAARNGIVAGLPHIALLRPGDRVAYIG